VINCCNKIRYNKEIGILCLHSDRMYDNLILGIHTMSIWFGLKTGCDTDPPWTGGHCRARELTGARSPAAPVPESSDHGAGEGKEKFFSE
jgi:hypothetical protein